MTNDSRIINRKDLCDIVTQTLIEDTISAIRYAEDNGWREKEDAVKLQADIEKIGKFCGITRRRLY